MFSFRKRKVIEVEGTPRPYSPEQIAKVKVDLDEMPGWQIKSSWQRGAFLSLYGMPLAFF